MQLADIGPRISPVERCCVAWSEPCSASDPMGRRQRMLGRLHEIMESFCPWAEVVRPGLCALPLRGPARVFGGEERLVDLLASKLSAEMPLEASPIGIGVADGLFAAYLAARLSLSTPSQGRASVARTRSGCEITMGKVLPGCTKDWLSPWPIGWLLPDEPAWLLERLGIETIGAFAGLDSQSVQERFGTDGSRLQEVARGVQSEPPGFRIPCSPSPKRCSSNTLPVASARAQRGFWGDRVDSERARRTCFLRVLDLLGPESLLVPRVSGSRSLRGEVAWLPWSAAGDVGRAPRNDPPWPGRLPAPQPILLMEHLVPAELIDAQGNTVGVGPNGLATSAPERLSLDGGSFLQVAAWSGPWPVDERWWDKRRRWARMQVLLSTGRACLLVLHPGSPLDTERGTLKKRKSSWWLEAVYE